MRSMLLLVLAVTMVACSTVKDAIDRGQDEVDKRVDAVGDALSIDKPIPVDQPAVAHPEPSTGQDLDWSRLTWRGGYSCANNPTVTMRSASIASGNGTISCDMDPYAWPSTVVNGKTCDAVACLAVEQADRSLVARKFDWWSIGGQRTGKVLHNIPERYDGWEVPASGTRCWYFIGDIHGSQRSTAAPCVWN